VERGPKKEEVSHQLNRSITLPIHELPPTVTADTQFNQKIFGNICRETEGHGGAALGGPQIAIR
jgi:hypothetical protein